MDRVRASVGKALHPRYVIKRELGQGAMALVFLAHDTKHDRDVAIKVLKPDLAHAIGEDRFQREIEVVSRLAHPHIMPLHDSGSVDGLLYYVMPFVEGESLRQRLEREERLPIVDAVRLVRQIADGLGFAHRHGVIHRDVKPANILLTEGHALLADFGIAHLAERGAGATLTGAGLALGTPTYVSPEQASGEGEVDGRSDIYSLGCVLYESLTGSPPFAGPSARAILTHHLVDPAPRTRTLRPEVSDGLEAVVQTALAKNPDDRFQTAEELGGALDLVGGGFEAMAAAMLRRLLGPQRWLRGWRPMALSAAALFFLIGAALIVTRTGGGGAALPRPLVSYLVLDHPGRGATAEEAELAQRAASYITIHLQDWKSIRVVSEPALDRPVAELQIAGFAGGSSDWARQLAATVEADVLIYVLARLQRDSLTVVASFHDPETAREVEDPLTESGFRQDLERITAQLALGILGLTGEPAELGDLIRRSPFHPAHQELKAGREALRSWRLAEAERHFEQAIREDSAFALAHHYLAETMYWRTARDPERLLDLGPAIEDHARRADRFDVEGRLRPGERRRLNAFRTFWSGDYDGARARYDSILAFDPTDMEALILAGAVEYEDPLLVPGEDDELVPRQDLDAARAAFDSATKLTPEWQLAWGRLFDIDMRLSRTAYEGTCWGFQPPLERLIPPWEVPEAIGQVYYCPIRRNGETRWIPDSLGAADRRSALAGARETHAQTLRRLEWWARVEREPPRYHAELADWLTWERYAAGCDADPAWRDSLTGQARRHLEAALAERTDTTPQDRIRLAMLDLATGDLEEALASTERGLAELGSWTEADGPTPPLEAANVYMAAGRAHPTVEIIERVWSETSTTLAVPDPRDPDEYIDPGPVFGRLSALRALGIMGYDGPDVTERLESLLRAWAPPRYSARQQAVLRMQLLDWVGPALVQVPAERDAWFAGWKEHGFEIPRVWSGFLVTDADTSAARVLLRQAVGELAGPRSAGLRATELFLPITLAERLGAESIASNLRARAARCPLRLNRVDFGWGMQQLLGGEDEGPGARWR